MFSFGIDFLRSTDDFSPLGIQEVEDRVSTLTRERDDFHQKTLTSIKAKEQIENEKKVRKIEEKLRKNFDSFLVFEGNGKSIRSSFETNSSRTRRFDRKESSKKIFFESFFSKKNDFSAVQRKTKRV